MVDLSVVVPAYNEEKRLPRMLDETLEFLEKRHNSKAYLPLYNNNNNNRASKFTYELIIVDDGSTDETTQCAKHYQDIHGDIKVRVITLPKNRGKGGAVKAGVLEARGKFIMFADADGATRFSDVEKLEDFACKNRDKDFIVAIGSRAHMEEEAKATRSLFRTILMKGFHLLVWTLCVRTIRDTQCGFKLFSQKAARLLFTSYHNNGWAFDVELLHLAEKTGCELGEIAVNWTEIEGSKIVPVLSWIRMGWDVLTIATLYLIGVYKVPDKTFIKTI